MIISYTLRVFCIVAVSAGVLLASAELLLWLTSPALLSLLQPLPARKRERAIYALQIVPCVLAFLGTSLWALPQYLHNETNPAPEGVSWFCLILTGTICCWFAVSLLRGIAALILTAKFARECKQPGSIQDQAHSGTPVVALDSAGHRVALVGLFRPFILVSRDWLENTSLAPEALQVVLAHENAHATQLDNWKLFLLRLLPSLHLPLRGGRTLPQLWQSSAEWAADDDASQADRSRAFLLAEALIVAVRSAPTRSAVIQTFLTYEESELSARIHRLIHPSPAPTTQDSRRTFLTLISATLVLPAALASVVWLVPSLHTLPEYFLHLG